jgi:hypothetical protein
MLSDSGMLRNGAGTYQATLPVYLGQVFSFSRPPTTMAAQVIQIGWPLALISLLLGVWLTILLFRGGLLRGRDYIFPSVAAACLVSVLSQAFCDASLLNPGIAVFVAIIVGLGLAQRTGQLRQPIPKILGT